MKMKIRLKTATLETRTPEIRTAMWSPTGGYIDEGMTWVLPNSARFTGWITRKYNEYRLSARALEITCQDLLSHRQKQLFPYQKFVRDYLFRTPYRGLLAYHEFGAGKTVTAAVTAEAFRRAGFGVVFMSPASVRENFVQTVFKWHPDLTQGDFDGSYHFVSSNAAQTLSQLAQVDLRNKLVIVDEVHNLISMMLNPRGKKGPKIYKDFMGIGNQTKFLFLTGSPIVNYPYELVFMLNILHGPFPDGSVLLPEDEEAFLKLYVDPTGKMVVNHELFRRRIAGLVSFYHGAHGNLYPKLVLEPLQKVSMSPFQLKEYLKARAIERSREPADEMEHLEQSAFKSKSKKKIGVSFRMTSRQISNFALPEELHRPTRREAYRSLLKEHLPADWTDLPKPILKNLDPERIPEFIEAYESAPDTAGKLAAIDHFLLNGEEETLDGKKVRSTLIDQEYQEQLKKFLVRVNALVSADEEHNIFLLKNLEQFSPKMARMLQTIDGGPGHEGPAFVYSQFRTIEGIGLFANVLKAAGFEQASPGIELSPGIRRFAIISGEESLEDRAKILETFNSKRNAHGETIKVILGTSAAAEGLNLFNVRQVLLMEPYWNEIRMRQVIARARRLCSHFRLPPEEWTVHVFRFMSVIHHDQKEKVHFAELETTDEVIYKVAQRKMRLNDEFLQLLKEAAVDCYLNHAHNTAEGDNVRCLPIVETDELAYGQQVSERDLDRFYSRSMQKREMRVAPVPLKKFEGAAAVILGEPAVKVRLSPEARQVPVLPGTKTPILVPGTEAKAKRVYDQNFLPENRVLVGYLVETSPGKYAELPPQSLVEV
ncbi:MAG: helicase-related protein [Sulfobacillus sp.]